MATAAPASDATPLVTIRIPASMEERFDWMAKVLQRPRTPYVAIYTVERGVVRIVALHHAAQNWPTEI